MIWENPYHYLTYVNILDFLIIQINDRIQAWIKWLKILKFALTSTIICKILQPTHQYTNVIKTMFLLVANHQVMGDVKR